jgi:hypothetical protein
MASLGDMVVRIRGDMTDFNKAIDSSEKQFKATAANFQKIGANMTKFVTVPLLAAGAGFLKLADTQVQAEAALANAIRATGKEATISVANLSKFAGELQKVTKFGDEAQLSALALVQQLADLNEDGLKAVLPGILNFSTAMGVDLQTAASLVGKTLGSSTNALSRYGVEIDATAGPTEKLAQLTEALEKRFGGAAEAAAKAGLGPLVQLKNSAGDLGEEFGKILIPGVIKLAESLKSVVESIQALDPATKTAIVQYGLLAAAIGPVILGSLKLLQVLPQLATAMKFVAASPVIIALAALAAGIALVAVESKKAATQAKAMQDALSGAADINAIQQSLALKRKEIELQKEVIRGAKGSIAEQALAQTQGKEALANLEAQERQLVANLNGKYQNIRAVEEQNKAAVALAEAEAKAAKAAADAAEARRVGNEQAIIAADEALKAAIAAEQQAQAEAEAKRKALNEELNFIAQVREAKNKALSEDTQVWIIQNAFRQKLDNEASENALKNIDKEKRARIEAARFAYGQIGSLVDQLTANEIARIEQSSDSEEVKAKKIAQAKYKQAKWDKAQAIIDIAIQTAVAITKALPNIFLAGIIGTLGAAQGLAVAAKPLPPVPLAEGGIVMPREGGTLAQIAEAGKPEAVIPLDRLGEMGGDIHLVVNLDSKPFLDKIFPATRNRTILISAGAVV